MLAYLPLFLGLSTAAAATATTSSTTTNLFVSHYSTGSVYTLSLNRSHDGAYSLSLASSLETCGAYPSWLTFDATTRILYCSDENGSATVNGSLTALKVAHGGGGSLVELAKTDSAPGCGVNSVVYEGDGGAKYLAIAHYDASAVSTFALPLTKNANPIQVFPFTLSSPGPVPDRQEAPHPHQTLLDPTGSFILVPDLGADLIRVFAIDKASGVLSTCPSLVYSPGGGPRHGVFYSTGGSIPKYQRQRRQPAGGAGAAASTILYVVGELNNEADVFQVTYPGNDNGGCLSFNKIQTLVPYPDGEVPAGAALGEIRLVDKNIYVSVRLDDGFPPNDSLAALVRAPNATLALDGISTSGGVLPRTFAVNKAGDLVAVGNQISSNVAIVTRDPVTGALGDVVASLVVGEPAELPGNLAGLSSVIWEE